MAHVKLCEYYKRNETKKEEKQKQSIQGKIIAKMAYKLLSVKAI